MTFDDLTLMAHADGELDAETSRRIEDAAARDPELAARIAAFRGSAAAVAAAFDPAPAVPDRLRANVEAIIAAARAAEQGAQNVVPLAPRGARPSLRPMWLGAVAATLALAVGLGAGLSLRAPAEGAGLSVAALGGEGIAATLASLPSGERADLPGGGTLEPIATFVTADGTICREFEVDGVQGGTVVSVACRAEGAWDVRLAIAAPAAEGGYAPASSLDTLDAWLNATGAGAPMSAEEEAAALAGN